MNLADSLLLGFTSSFATKDPSSAKPFVGFASSMILALRPIFSIPSVMDSLSLPLPILHMVSSDGNGSISSDKGIIFHYGILVTPLKQLVDLDSGV